VDEGLLFTLVDAEGRGHLCLEKHAFIKAALKLLDTEGLTEEMAACRAMVLVNQGQLVCYGGDVFRSKTAAVEGALARATIKQLNNKINCQYDDLDAELERRKAREGIRQEIIEVSTLLAEKILEREVNSDDHTELINTFLDNIGDGNEQ
jgi:hypothetical protein